MMSIGVSITCGGQSIETVEQSIHQVIKRPTRHNNVVTKNEPRSNDAEFADFTPKPSIGKFAESLGCIGMSMAPNNKLCGHKGDAQNEYAQNIHEDKRSSAIVAGHHGKSPDVSQTYCRTGCGQYHSYFTIEFRSVACLHEMSFRNNFCKVKYN